MNRTTIILLIATIACSCLVVAIRHQNRLEFVYLQGLESERDDLQAEWGRLMLEKATWSLGHSLTEDVASRLGMSPPEPDEIITVDLQAADGGGI